jgi:epoxyqueuosine reductase QueG
VRELTEMLEARGAVLVGFADLRGLPADVRRGLPFAVSIAVALDPGIVSEIPNGPHQDYADLYRRANRLLDELAEAAAEFLRERGYEAIALAATGKGIDAETLSTRLPNKTAATRAGLGWIGKMALLVTEEYGSAVRLVTVLTNAEGPGGESINSSRCGECRACVEACPANASKDALWEVGIGREELFDAFACRRTTRERAERFGIRGPSCGIWIAVCPWTKQYLECSLAAN